MATKKFSGSFARKDNKALSAQELIALFNTIPLNLRDKPVTLYSDEEGNDKHHLWSVEISPKGEVSLWPAGDSLMDDDFMDDD
jgi:hypothetical protein